MKEKRDQYQSKPININVSLEALLPSKNTLVKVAFGCNTKKNKCFKYIKKALQEYQLKCFEQKWFPQKHSRNEDRLKAVLLKALYLVAYWSAFYMCFLNQTKKKKKTEKISSGYIQR